MTANERERRRRRPGRGATRPVSMPPDAPRHSRESGNLLGGVRPRKREHTPRHADGCEIPAYAGMTALGDAGGKAPYDEANLPLLTKARKSVPSRLTVQTVPSVSLNAILEPSGDQAATINPPEGQIPDAQSSSLRTGQLERSNPSGLIMRTIFCEFQRLSCTSNSAPFGDHNT